MGALKATEEDFKALHILCVAIQEKIKDLDVVIGSQALEDWQVFGAKHLLSEVDLKLECVHKTLSPVKRVRRDS